MTSTSRELFLPQDSRSSSLRRRRPMTRSDVAEVAGGTTADIAAVCCCCPCGLVNLVVLVVYKLPAGICRRVVRKVRRDRLVKKGMTGRVHCTCGCERKLVGFNSVGFESLSSEFEKFMLEESDDESCDEEIVQLEKEMWDRFYGTGFWRSPTQRASPPSLANSNGNSPDDKAVVSGR